MDREGCVVLEPGRGKGGGRGERLWNVGHRGREQVCK